MGCSWLQTGRYPYIKTPAFMNEYAFHVQAFQTRQHSPLGYLDTGYQSFFQTSLDEEKLSI